MKSGLRSTAATDINGDSRLLTVMVRKKKTLIKAPEDRRHAMRKMKVTTNYDGYKADVVSTEAG